MADHWRDVAKRVRNWGKWGPHDQLGTLNYITPEKVLQAAGLYAKAARFRSVSRSMPTDHKARTVSVVIRFTSCQSTGAIRTPRATSKAGAGAPKRKSASSGKVRCASTTTTSSCRCRGYAMGRALPCVL